MSVAPVLARVEPIAGESLLSLVARTAQANVFPKLADFLSHAGIAGHPAFAPFTASGRARPLAELLGAPQEEVASRFHPLHPDQSLKDARVWAGVRVRRRAIEARARRVAPAALKISQHHRLEWTHRALTFCPQTLQRLISTCPACHIPLGWVTTKGLDRCEHCEASLAEADAPMVQTRSPERLRAAAGLISPDPATRRAVLATLPPEFQAWDAGDLFAALCELGVAWRRPGEGRGSATARALSDGSYDFQPEDIARGYAIVRDWPERQGELLARLADEASSHRTNGRLTFAHLGVLGRRLTAMSTGSTLGGLLMRAVETEARARRARAEEAVTERAALEAKKVGSVGLVEACETFGVSRPVLKRLAPDGRAFISAQPRRLGGVRFDADVLAATLIAYQSAESASDVARLLGAPRYVVAALIDAGLLDACDDRDVELLMNDRAVTARSFSALCGALETPSTDRKKTQLFRSLSVLLRRRFDPTIWVAAIDHACDAAVPMFILDEVSEKPLIDRVLVTAYSLVDQLRSDNPDNIPRGERVSAREAGRLLGLSSTHLPELVEAKLLKGACEAEGWTYQLGDLVDFHAAFVTASELRQRQATLDKDIAALPGVFEDQVEPLLKLSDLAEVVSTRHFALSRREEVEMMIEWPDPLLR